MIVVGRGFCFEDLKLGFRFRTHRRTIAEADVAAFVNLTWLTEELFTVEDDAARAIKGRAVPGALVYAFAEGLLLPTMQDTGLAFLNATLDVKGADSGRRHDPRRGGGDRAPAHFQGRSRAGALRQQGGQPARRAVLEYNPLRLLKRK